MTQPKTQNNIKQELYDPFAIMNTDKGSESNQNDLIMLDLISRVKKHITEAPTFVPSNFYEQVQFFYDGTDYKLYLYINGVWKNIAIT